MKRENDVKRYEPIKAIDLINRVKKGPKRKFIWGGIREGSMGLLIGAGKTGKTTFAENLAISIAVGRVDFFGFKIDGGAQKVAFINLEEDYSITGDRLGREITNLNARELELFTENFIATPEGFPSYINDKQDWLILKNYISDSEADIIFLDSLSHLFVGEIEKSSVAQSWMQEFRDHVASLGKTVIVVHHTTKGNDSPINMDKGAGSRVISQEFNWAYGFAKIPTATGGSYLCHMYNKFQFADETQALLYEVQDNNWIKYKSKANKYSLYSEVKIKNDGRRNPENEELIYNYMIDQVSQGSQTISTSELKSEFVETTTMSKDTFHRKLNNLIESGKIVREGIGGYKILKSEEDDVEGRF